MMAQSVIISKRIETARTIYDAAMKHAHEPAITKDGIRLEVVSNIGNVEGARASIENGAEGVGLLSAPNSFILSAPQYLQRKSNIRHIKQYWMFSENCPLSYAHWMLAATRKFLIWALRLNPILFLGSARYDCAWFRPDIFKPQLRAALRAGVGNNLKMMFPMVATAQEVRDARKVLDECIRELKAKIYPSRRILKLASWWKSPLLHWLLISLPKK